MFISVFSLNIVYFSVCLTSNKLYWIEDQLADISTRFYMSASWRRRVDWIPCVAMSLASLIYNKRDGIVSSMDLVHIMNIGNELYSGLSSLSR